MHFIFAKTLLNYVARQKFDLATMCMMHSTSSGKVLLILEFYHLHLGNVSGTWLSFIVTLWSNMLINHTKLLNYRCICGNKYCFYMMIITRLVHFLTLNFTQGKKNEDDLWIEQLLAAVVCWVNKTLQLLFKAPVSSPQL